MLYTGMVWLTPLWAGGGTLGLIAPAAWTAAKILLWGNSFSFLMNTGLPTLAAAASWRWGFAFPFLFFVGLPLASFSLFMALVGMNAHLLFACCWLLLPLAYGMPRAVRDHFLIRSVVASLVAHMVGTLLLLLCGKAAGWASLAMVVPFERLVTAAGVSGVFLLKRYCLGGRKQAAW